MDERPRVAVMVNVPEVAVFGVSVATPAEVMATEAPPVEEAVQLVEVPRDGSAIESKEEKSATRTAEVPRKVQLS